MDSDNSDDGFAAQKPGEALQMDEDFDSEDDQQLSDEEPAMPNKPQQSAAKPQPVSNVKGQEVQNQPFDLAVSVNDSEEVDSEEEEEEVQMSVQQQMQPQAQQQNAGTQKMAAPMAPKEEDDDEDEKQIPGAYNPLEYANLPVSGEVKELFEYIQRFKPQVIDLESKIRPFVPDFVPAVGEVDAFLKMKKPDGTDEDLGITVLDEPALNSEDKTVLELKYVQSKNVVRSTPMDVDSIDQADKKPKEIGRWISAVQDLHKTRPPPTVNYSKAMPEFDALMEEWQPEMEQAFQQIDFPDAEIDMHVSDYARLVLSMTDIPVHKTPNNKAVIESLHVLFTLFVEFRNNQHFKQFQNNGDDGATGAQF